MTDPYYRGAHGVVFVFAINSRESFEKLPVWIESVEHHKIPFQYIIANKCDLASEVSEYDISKFKIPYVKTSAKTGENVGEVFETIARKLVETTSTNNPFDVDKGGFVSVENKPKVIEKRNNNNKCCGTT